MSKIYKHLTIRERAVVIIKRAGLVNTPAKDYRKQLPIDNIPCLFLGK